VPVVLAPGDGRIGILGLGFAAIAGFCSDFMRGA
jgi:hypothetical protein